MRGIVPRKRLRDLASNPLRCRICSDADPDEVAALQTDDDEHIQQIEANGRNNEQVHGGNIRRVIAYESEPSLRRRTTSLDHVLGDAGLGHVKAELEQFAMDARCAPQRVVHAHSLDQNPQVRVDGWPASARARFPTPVASKASSMPTHDRLRSDDRDCLQDRRKPPLQLDEEQAIGIRELNATSYLAPQHGHLMLERGILRRKLALRPKGRGEQRQQEAEQREHGRLTVSDSLTKSTRMEFSVHTTEAARRWRVEIPGQGRP